MRALLLGIVFALPACPHPMPTPPAPPAPHVDPTAIYCPADRPTPPVNADLCPGLSVGGYQCIRCREASACVDRMYQVYCVSSCAECHETTHR